MAEAHAIASAGAHVVSLHLGTRPAVAFDRPPPPVLEWLHSRYGALLDDGDGGAPVRVRFADLTPPPGSVRLAIDAITIAGTPSGEFLLVDGAERAAQLPRFGTETELVCDPAFDLQMWGPFHTWLERVIDWQASSRGMVTSKGAVVGLPEGNVAIGAFQGSGKTSTVLSLLDDATAYLGEDRLTFGRVGDRVEAAAFPVPLNLCRGRRYDLPSGVLERGLNPFDRRLLELVPRLPRRVQSALSTRWVGLDVAAAFPDVDRPRTLPIDAIVFVQPHQAPLALTVLDRERVLGLACQLTRFHHDRYVAPFHQLHAAAFPHEPSWPIAPPSDDRLGEVLGDLPGFLLRVPVGGPARAVADAVRNAVRTRVTAS